MVHRSSLLLSIAKSHSGHPQPKLASPDSLAMATLDLTAIRSPIGDLRTASDGLVALLATCIGVAALTYLISTIQGAVTVHNKRHGARPPKLPYATPLLGHLPEFLKDTMKFLARATYV